MTQTPKDKAVELVDKYLMLVGSDWNGKAKAKQCAIIAVDEMIKLNGELYLTDNKSQELIAYYKSKNAYLFEVKEEIENL